MDQGFSLLSQDANVAPSVQSDAMGCSWIRKGSSLTQNLMSAASILAGIATVLSLAGCDDPVGFGFNESRKLWIGETGWNLEVGDSVDLGVYLGDARGTVQFQYPPSPAYDWPTDLRIQWQSSDPAIASISPSGAIHARAPGRVMIRGTVDDASDTVTVVVRPSQRPTGMRYSAVSTGGAHACALSSDGRVYCWGSNWYGQLATGTARRHTAYLMPVQSAAPMRFTSIVAGDRHNCGISEGAVRCWGAASFGVLGDGRIPWMEHSARPVVVSHGERFSSIASGVMHNCGLMSSGIAYCWGLNEFGQLGNGGSASTAVPQQVKEVPPFVELALGLHHSCGLTDDGQAYCWVGTTRVNSGPATRPRPPGRSSSLHPIASRSWRQVLPIRVG